jgi:hypothetical protein
MMLFYHEKENLELDEYDCDLIRDKEKRDECFESKMSLDDDDESSSTSSSSSCDE